MRGKPLLAGEVTLQHRLVGVELERSDETLSSSGRVAETHLREPSRCERDRVGPRVHCSIEVFQRAAAILAVQSIASAKDAQLRFLRRDGNSSIEEMQCAIDISGALISDGTADEKTRTVGQTISNRRCEKLVRAIQVLLRVEQRLA